MVPWSFGIQVFLAIRGIPVGLMEIRARPRTWKFKWPWEAGISSGPWCLGIQVVPRVGNSGPDIANYWPGYSWHHPS